MDAYLREDVVFGRLRHDACLFDVPELRPWRQQQRKYGRGRVRLREYAKEPDGWTTDRFELYGRQVRKKFKTFLATRPGTAGLIRVLLVKEPGGYAAFYATSPDVSVCEMLQAVSGRLAIAVGPSGDIRPWLSWTKNRVSSTW